MAVSTAPIDERLGTLQPLNPEERRIVALVVNAAPALRPALVAELSALLGAR